MITHIYSVGCKKRLKRMFWGRTLLTCWHARTHLEKEVHTGLPISRRPMQCCVIAGKTKKPRTPWPDLHWLELLLCVLVYVDSALCFGLCGFTKKEIQLCLTASPTTTHCVLCHCVCRFLGSVLVLFLSCFSLIFLSLPLNPRCTRVVVGRGLHYLFL